MEQDIYKSIYILFGDAKILFEEILSTLNG